MNYLQLTNDYLAETGAGDPIGSVVNQTDEYRQATTWIADAWVEIQRNRRWRFRWAEDTFTTVGGQGTYSLSELGKTSGTDIDVSSFRLAGSSASLAAISHRQMQTLEKGANSYAGTPRYIALYPDDTLHVYPKPDAALSMSYEYYAAPTFLVADLDTPTLQPAFHKAIVWKAVEQYAREQGKEWQALYQAAIRNFNAIYSVMLHRETGSVRLSPSPLSRN